MLALGLLVDRVEVRDLVAQRLREVVERLHVVPVRIAQRDAADLVVDALVVAHAEQGDHLHGDDAAGERRLADAHHRVERVAVLAARVGNESVVGGIDHRREEEPVELDGLQLLVPLVLVARALGNLDEAVQVGHGSGY